MQNKETKQEQLSFHTENFRKRSRYTFVFVCMIAAFFVITVLNINTGNVHISVPKILRILFLHDGEAVEYSIIWKIRLPRILMAALLGGALSLSGFLLQTFFSNPMIVFLKYVGHFSSYTLVVAAFIGSLISTGFILLMSKKIHHMASLLVGGIMIGYICSAITDFVVTFADDSDIVNLHGWSQGSFSGMSWGNIKVAVVVVGIAAVCTFLLSKPISAYQLGEAYAQSMGVNIKVFRVVIILLSSILSACVTAFAGPISFVGIAVPFLTRKAFGTSKPIVVIPGTFFIGAVFCMICDLIARMALAPVELNISTVTSILGAPIVIYMMVKREKGRM